MSFLCPKQSSVWHSLSKIRNAQVQYKQPKIVNKDFYLVAIYWPEKMSKNKEKNRELYRHLKEMHDKMQ